MGEVEHHKHHHEEQAEGNKSERWMKGVAIGTALVSGAVILSPYILPMLGIGNNALAEEAMLAMHGTGLGNGLAGAVNTAINAVPLVGPTLAQGGFATAAAAGSVGIGGVLVGQYIDDKQKDKTKFRWGKWIKRAAVSTSALISLPALCTGLSVGVVYLCAAFSGVETASTAVALMANTLGSVGSMNVGTVGAAGATAVLPHMITCGAPIIPAALSFGLFSRKKRKGVGSNKENDNEDNQPDILATIEIAQPLVLNQPCHVRLKLAHADSGLPVTPEELETVHTEKLHLLAVDQSLKDYHHIHPVPSATEPGVYEFTFTPQSPCYYNAWAEIVPVATGEMQRLKTQIPGSLDRNGPASVIPSQQAEQSGIRCEWKAEQPLQGGKASLVEVSLTDAYGNPVTDLQPVMGAYAHLVGFSADGQSVLHAHPEGDEITNFDARGGPKLRFHVEPEQSGPAQFYLQVKRGGQDIYFPIGQVIKPSARHADKIHASNGHATGHHHV